MQPIHGEHPYIFVDGVYLKRSWGGEVQNVSVLVAVGVNDEGYREILGVAEDRREDKESWGCQRACKMAEVICCFSLICFTILQF